MDQIIIVWKWCCFPWYQLVNLLTGSNDTEIVYCGHRHCGHRHCLLWPWPSNLFQEHVSSGSNHPQSCFEQIGNSFPIRVTTLSASPPILFEHCNSPTFQSFKRTNCTRCKLFKTDGHVIEVAFSSAHEL